jgi:hypothetical protein
MLTNQEVSRIFSWLPYRDDWPVHRNQVNDRIQEYYGDLINQLTNNKVFSTYYSEDGGLANYLEFFCYPAGQSTYEGNAVMVCVSLCAPLAAYGQTKIWKAVDSVGWARLFSPNNVNVISDNGLFDIEKEIKRILASHKLNLLDRKLATKPLPLEVCQSLQFENNLNEGDQYLHGIFQKID